MQFLKRTGIFTLQLAVFFLLLALLSQAATYFTAERYSPGDTPSRLFPLVALPPGAVPAGERHYELLRWPQLARKDPPPLAWNLRLVDAKGEFVSPVIGGFEPTVHFDVADAAEGRQRVDVKVTDKDYVIYAVYVTDGVKVMPEFFRIWGPTSALVAVFPAFVLTVALSRLLRRRRERAKAGPG